MLPNKNFIFFYCFQIHHNFLFILTLKQKLKFYQNLLQSGIFQLLMLVCSIFYFFQFSYLFPFFKGFNLLVYFFRDILVFIDNKLQNLP